MTNEPNVVLRGGPADGEILCVHALGDPVSVEDVGGGSITYVDHGERQEHEGVQLQVYVPKM